MSRKYKFYNSSRAHFVSFATVSWLDVFTRQPYFNVVTESLSYCINNKGLVVNAWCIMRNHLHLIIRSDTNQLGAIMRDMKKYTAKKLISCIHDNSRESRKERWLHTFKQAGRANSNNKTYQFWQQHNHPIVLSTPKMIGQRIQYLHNNPVKAGYVSKPEDWLYSSAKSYAGLDGMLDVEHISLNDR